MIIMTDNINLRNFFELNSTLTAIISYSKCILMYPLKILFYFIFIFDFGKEGSTVTTQYEDVEH